MAVNRELAAEATESTANYHEELHGQYPEDRDLGVDGWFNRRDQLSEYDDSELVAVDRELSELPEVKAQRREKVTLSGIEEMLTRAKELSPETADWTEPSETFAELYEQLQHYINKYAETLRRFAVVKTQSFHLEREQYQTRMKDSDQARRNTHEALISHLNGLSRFLAVRIPKIGGRGFDQPGWEHELTKHWFTIDQLQDRDYIANWAIRTDIAEKAAAIQAAIKQTREKKSTATN